MSGGTAFVCGLIWLTPTLMSVAFIWVLRRQECPSDSSRSNVGGHPPGELP